MTKKVDVPASGRPFKNNVAYCVGTGRMGLALQKEYIDHLKMVQDTVIYAVMDCLVMIWAYIANLLWMIKPVLFIISLI
jgi:hypothetical protein